MPHIVVLDVETTGLGRQDGRDDGVVQVGLATRDPDTAEIVTWSEVCNPGREYLAGGRADEALEINGLTKDEVLSARPAREVAADLQEKLEGLRDRAHDGGLGSMLDRLRGRFGGLDLRAYNVRFDRPFLQAEPWRIDGPWGPCLMLMAHRALNPHGKWPKLVEACEVLGVGLGDEAHDAGTDAEAALRVWELLEESV